jgi:addiction module HigA family antidote
MINRASGFGGATAMPTTSRSSATTRSTYGVPARRINEIVHGKRAVSADTALRLARYFSTSDRFWLNLRARFDLETERDRLGRQLVEEVAVLAGI